MVILITGGYGFLGSHLSDLLLENGYTIRIIDNLCSGKLENLSHHKTNTNLEFFKADITEKRALKSAFVDIDAVFHLAAQIDVRKSTKDPLFDAKVNILGSLNLLELARECDISQFIFSSSGGAIYGSLQQLPITELGSQTPESPYGVSKLTFERYLQVYQHLYGLKSTILRYANIFGPRQDSQGEAGVIMIFLAQILQNTSLTIFGNGSQTRDYLFVSDAASAALQTFLQKKDGIFNIGTGIETSVNELAQIVFEVTKTEPNIKYLPERAGEVQRSCLDSSFVKQSIGWTPITDLKEGVIRTWEWLQKQPF